jgi:hypothetical protein
MCAITGGKNATEIAADENESKRTRGGVNGFCKLCWEFASTVAVSFVEGTKSPSSTQPLYIAKLFRIPLICYVLQLYQVLLLTAAAFLVKTLESVDTFQLAATRFSTSSCHSPSAWARHLSLGRERPDCSFSDQSAHALLTCYSTLPSERFP